MQIEIAGKQLQLRFGMHLGQMLIQDNKGRKGISTQQFLAGLIYYAHENYCLGYDMQTVMTKGEIFLFLEDNINDPKVAAITNAVVLAYNESKPAQAIYDATGIQNPAKAPTKKKLTGQK